MRRMLPFAIGAAIGSALMVRIMVSLVDYYGVAQEASDLLDVVRNRQRGARLAARGEVDVMHNLRMRAKANHPSFGRR